MTPIHLISIYTGRGEVMDDQDEEGGQGFDEGRFESALLLTIVLAIIVGVLLTAIGIGAAIVWISSALGGAPFGQAWWPSGFWWSFGVGLFICAVGSFVLLYKGVETFP